MSSSQCPLNIKPLRSILPQGLLEGCGPSPSRGGRIAITTSQIAEWAIGNRPMVHSEDRVEEEVMEVKEGTNQDGEAEEDDQDDQGEEGDDDQDDQDGEEDDEDAPGNGVGRSEVMDLEGEVDTDDEETGSLASSQDAEDKGEEGVILEPEGIEVRGVLGALRDGGAEGAY